MNNGLSGLPSHSTKFMNQGLVVNAPYNPQAISGSQTQLAIIADFQFSGLIANLTSTTPVTTRYIVTPFGIGQLDTSQPNNTFFGTLNNVRTGGALGSSRTGFAIVTGTDNPVAQSNGTIRAFFGTGMRAQSNGFIGFSATTDATATSDISFFRNATNIIELNSGTSGVFNSSLISGNFTSTPPNASLVQTVINQSATKAPTVSNKALTTNVATLTTSTNHGFYIGETVVVTGVDATFNGTFVITSIPSVTTFTYAKTASNVGSTASSGTVTVTQISDVFQTFLGATKLIYITPVSTGYHNLNIVTDISGTLNSTFSAVTSGTTTFAFYGTGGFNNGFCAFATSQTIQTLRCGFGAVGLTSTSTSPFGSGSPSSTILSQTNNTTFANIIAKGIANQTGDQLQLIDSTSTVQSTFNYLGMLGIGIGSKLSTFTVQQPATTVIAGTTSASAVTTITGVSTKFTTQVGIGDRISLSSASTTYGTVTAIGNDTTLTVDTALGNGTSQTINVLHAIARLQDNGSNIKFIISDSGRISIGGAPLAPLAALHLPAGTATAGFAPLKLTNGTNLTTAETGAIEYDGTTLFFTRIGTTRESILTGNSGASAPATTIGAVITNYYGSSATNFLGTPNSWISVVINGTTYKIPLYT